jgi:hypothetical protein
VIKLIILDPSLIIPFPEADFTVAEISQYFSAYTRIVGAIHTKSDLQVVVTDKQVGKWLNILQSRYGKEYVEIEEISLKRQLSKQIGIIVPEIITDQQIKESNLLDLSIPAAANSTFDDYLLEVFFGGFLVSEGGLKKIGEIVTNYEPDQWEAALRRPLVHELYFNKLREIRERLVSEKRNGEIILLDWLENSPKVLLRNLSVLKMVIGYPESFGKRLLGNAFPNIRDLKLDYRKVPLIVKGNERVLDEIRVYLTSRNDPKDLDELIQLVEQMSGLLEIEFSTIYHILQKGNINIDVPFVEKIKSKFKPIQEIPNISQVLTTLDLMITRPRPTVPEPEWTEEEWVHWASESYLPYRFWLENTGQLNDEIAEIAGEYSDWFFENFGNLKYHSKKMAWKWLLDLSNQWKEMESPVLVVMADNLNAKFYPDLLHQLQVQGFYEQQMDYCFSMLPSCTEVSKKCIITGHYQPFKETSYKNQVESTWNARLQKKVLYVGSIGEFRGISKREHDIYFLNYLPLDITLHQDENQTGLSHPQAIRNFLVSLSQDIRAFAERIGADRDLTVVVISDHGSTRIPKGTINVIQGDYYRKRADDEHHRYISISDEEIKKLPENYKYDCYLLKREVMDLETNYLVARRLYRFLPTSENAYIHGGLTPEETLIPSAVYRPIIVSPKPLTVSVTGNNKIYVGTKFDLSLEITNLNNYSCDDSQIEVLDANLETAKLKLGNLGKLIRLPVIVPSRCVRNAETGLQKLHIRLTFEFLGQPCVNDILIPVEIIEPAKPKFDLDNL